jgi:hypothetical protein
MVTEKEEKGSYSQGRWVPPPFKWPKMSDGELQVVRKRQRERARVMAILLGAFVVLMFFITIAKTGMNW